MKKRLLIFITVILSCIACFCSACSSYTSSLVFYENTENGAYLYGIGDIAVVENTDMSIEKLVIPSTYNGKSVTIIGACVFEYCKSLTEVVLPESIKYISDRAFAECSKLESLSLPNNVIYIGEDAFRDDIELATLYIGNKIEMIYVNAFKNCNQLKDVYYKGTQEEWENIEIWEGNECLLNADIHFES